MYLLVIFTFLAQEKTLAKPLCECLSDHVEAEIAAHTAKCLGSVRLFSSELLIEMPIKCTAALLQLSMPGKPI